MSLGLHVPVTETPGACGGLKMGLPLRSVWGLLDGLELACAGRALQGPQSVFRCTLCLP